MSVEHLITDLARLEIRIEADGDRLRYSPQSAVTPELAERMKAYKHELLAMLLGKLRPEVVHDYNDWCWQNISQADREYLLGPRNWPEPCLWCGGRLVHSQACHDLKRSWIPVIPFGRHRGRRADKVPTDYIVWVLSMGVGSRRFLEDLRKWYEEKILDHSTSISMIGHGKTTIKENVRPS